MNPLIVSSFVIVFRETLEAALIVGIILAFLARTRAQAFMKHVLSGTVSALAASGVIAFIFERTVGSFEGRAAEIFEGLVALLASGILTYMIFWMHRQASQIRIHMEAELGAVVNRKDLWALWGMAFFAVLREGAETILFLKAAALQAGGAVSVLGGFSGFFLAVGLTAAVFWFGRKIPLKPFFHSTGFLLTLMAAGLLGYGIHELEEAGWLPALVEHVWNLNSLLNEKEGIGSFLKAIFGYNGNPSLLEAVSYYTYLLGILTLLQRRKVSGALTLV